MVQQLRAAGADVDAAQRYADTCDMAQPPSEVAAACALLRQHAASSDWHHQQQQQVVARLGLQYVPRSAHHITTCTSGDRGWSTLEHSDVGMLALEPLTPRRMLSTGIPSQQLLLAPAFNRKLDTLKAQLADNPGSVAVVDGNGSTALHWAVYARFAEGVSSSVSSGGKP